MIRDGLGFPSPRQYQVDALFHLAYRKIRLMYLIRKTGEGKSLVIMGLALALDGIIVAMGPLHGLGTDQANKSKRPNSGLEAYHVDEFREGDYDKLVYRLTILKRSHHRRIVLYISMEAITSLVSLSQRHNPTLHLPTVAMSATFRIPEQKLFNTLFGAQADLVSWGAMDKRSVAIMCMVIGNPLNQLAKDLAADASDEKDSQFLVYSNSAKACEEDVIERIESKLGVVPKEHLAGKVIFALTGKLGIMGKSFLAEAFAGEDNDDTLPTIFCMPCTEAAQCGVSSNRCNKCFRYGLIPSVTMMVQELGRVNRLLMAIPGAHGYYVFANVTSFISLWIRAKRQPLARVRRRHEQQMMDNTRRLILPSECYHTSIEREFENPSTFVDRGPCGTLCSFCTGGSKEFTNEFSKAKLKAALMSNIFDRGSVPARKFVGFITDKANQNKLRKQIWGDGVAVTAGNIHALVLQLFVSGIIELFLQHDDMVGKDNIEAKHVMIRLTKRTVSDSTTSFEDFKLNDNFLFFLVRS